MMKLKPNMSFRTLALFGRHGLLGCNVPGDYLEDRGALPAR